MEVSQGSSEVRDRPAVRELLWGIGAPPDSESRRAHICEPHMTNERAGEALKRRENESETHEDGLVGVDARGRPRPGACRCASATLVQSEVRSCGHLCRRTEPAVRIRERKGLSRWRKKEGRMRRLMVECEGGRSGSLFEGPAGGKLPLVPG